MNWFRNAVCLALLAVATFGSAAQANEGGELPQVFIKMRFLQGSRDNARKVKELSAPTVLATSGQSAHAMIGQEHLETSTGMRITSGVDCRVKPTLRDDGRVSVELEFSVTHPVKDVDSGVAVQGTCIRSNLLVTPGKCRQIGGLKGGKHDETWLELTAELATPPATDAAKP